MLSYEPRDRSKAVRLYKLSNNTYLYKSLAYEANCTSMLELFQIAQQFFQIPLAEIELALLTMLEKDHNYAEFAEPHMIFMHTGRSDQ